MAWLIAIFALIFNGGIVTEFISRLPSAIAAIALLVETWRLTSSYSSTKNGWRVMLILATMFEFFRAAVACRVDMILTTCMVGGIYAMFTASKHPLRILWAILLFSGATLTKGPVGTLLPCLALGIYFVLEGQNFFKTFFKLTLVAICSFILPAVWYWLAYRQGGEVFGTLAWEENIGRLTGTMSYDSHVNPWYYNITSLLAGCLPWTVPVIIGLFYKRVRNSVQLKRFKHGFPLLCICVCLTIFIFYCIPSSKRSVYLLPCYPFLAIGATFILGKLAETKLTRIWAIILSVIAIIAPIAMIILTNIRIENLKVESPGTVGWIISFVPLLAGCWWLFTRSSRANGLAGSIGMTYLIMLAYNSTYMPAFVNPRSDKQIAAKIELLLPKNAPIE
ncbi:MAG: glycosyltransferase family 39 protein, partial [Muribaculaceae bacterium]|nr:glycosyltransferase family 39 protein [Muribaculaceae bacterium]